MNLHSTAEVQRRKNVAVWTAGVEKQKGVGFVKNVSLEAAFPIKRFYVLFRETLLFADFEPAGLMLQGVCLSLSHGRLSSQLVLKEKQKVPLTFFGRFCKVMQPVDRPFGSQGSVCIRSSGRPSGFFLLPDETLSKERNGRETLFLLVQEFY